MWSIFGTLAKTECRRFLQTIFADDFYRRFRKSAARRLRKGDITSRAGDAQQRM